MANDPNGLGQADPRLRDYLAEVLAPEDEVLREIRERSERAGLPPIQVAAFDGRHLTVLARACGARRIVEIGTLGGYSGVCMARALPEGGRLDTFEYEPAHARVAEESFRRAGLSDRVRVHVGAALDNLPRIEAEGPFDLVFVDADKKNYVPYRRWARANLRRGGVLLADNVFRALLGEAPEWTDEQKRALDAFNRELAADPAFATTFVPTVEGLALAVRI